MNDYYTMDRVQRIIRDGILPSWTTQELRELLAWLEKKLDEFNRAHPIIAMGSGEWDHTKFMNALVDVRAALRRC